MASDFSIVVAVDFGTTYSGVAFCSTSNNNSGDIELVNIWPGKREVVNKVPTRLAYASENNDLKSDRWGFAVTGKMHSYSWMKLLLDTSAKLSDYDDPALNDMYGAGMMRTPTDKSPEQLCTDYLKCLHEFIEDQLIRRFSRGIYENTSIKCKLTVPAIWSDAAKAATRAAAIKAGFGSRLFDTVELIPEPEAAALAALKPRNGNNLLDPIKAGDNILVCDCGGGTVDVTAYTIIEVAPQLEFEELCCGGGGKCGSTYIDRNFNSWMVKTFGNAFTSIEPKKRGPGSQMMQNFEAAKMAFGSHRGASDEHLFEIENVIMKGILEDDANLDRYDPDENTLKLTWKEMQSFFDPVVDQVISLVESQTNQAAAKSHRIGRIILVGGFGDSEYLNEKMETWCRLKGDIKLVCPPQCQAAVVRGAAIRGLEGLKPKSRIARRHYGYRVAKTFVEGVHDEWRSYFDYYYNQKRCADLASWKIEKGQSIDATTKAPFVMCRTMCDTERRYDSSVSLYCCTYEESPLYADHWKAEKVGEVQVSFTDAEIDASPRRYNKRMKKWYRCVDYTLEIDLAADQGTLEFKSFINDRPGGTARIKFHDS